MTPDEKIFHVLEAIEDERALESGESIHLLPLSSALKCTLNDFFKILSKLQKEGILEFREYTYGPDLRGSGVEPACEIKILKGFDERLADLSKKVGSSHIKISEKSAVVKKEVNAKAVHVAEAERHAVLQITYTDARQIILNNIFVLAKPNFNSENDNVFQHLYNKPNQSISREELNKVLGKKVGKSLSDIVKDLGFKQSLRTVFFDVSANDIQFHNPITHERLHSVGISLDQIRNELRK